MKVFDFQNLWKIVSGKNKIPDLEDLYQITWQFRIKEKWHRASLISPHIDRLQKLMAEIKSDPIDHMGCKIKALPVRQEDAKSEYTFESNEKEIDT